MWRKKTVIGMFPAAQKELNGELHHEDIINRTRRHRCLVRASGVYPAEAGDIHLTETFLPGGRQKGRHG